LRFATNRDRREWHAGSGEPAVGAQRDEPVRLRLARRLDAVDLHHIPPVEEDKAPRDEGGHLNADAFGEPETEAILEPGG
jgi:hypothetical protein